jgi:hypothetical protein
MGRRPVRSGLRGQPKLPDKQRRELQVDATSRDHVVAGCLDLPHSARQLAIANRSPISL